MGQTKFRGYVSAEFLLDAICRANEAQRQIAICESVKDKTFYTLFADIGAEEAILIITPKQR